MPSIRHDRKGLKHEAKASTQTARKDFDQPLIRQCLSEMGRLVTTSATLLSPGQ